MNPGDLIVGGFNIDTGSSREQAVTALLAAKIARAVALWRGAEYPFAALGTTVQEIVVAGGVENQVGRAPGSG